MGIFGSFLLQVVCMVSDAKTKIEAGDFSMPVVERIAPLEFLFLTCNNSDSYLRESREPLPAIYPLICQKGEDNTATLVPWDNQDPKNQGPSADPTWLKCIEPSYCHNFPTPPNISLTTTTTTTTLTPPLPGQPVEIYTPTPTSQLARVDSKLKTGAPCKGEPFCVREYDNVEYKCEVDDHVAEWASVFEVMCHANGSFVEPTVWPICRPSVKCNNTVPAAPFYTNLVTVSTPPIKEYDMVEYTCYDETLKLINNSKVLPKFEIECGSDTRYKNETEWHDWDYKWPICQKQGEKKCHCLGDSDITNSTACTPPNDGSNATVCPARELLDKVCRNHTKVKVMNNMHIPLKDRCGTYDPENPTLDNMCYCEQREDEGVKDAYIIDFHITSELWDKQMSFATTDIYKGLKYRVEQNIDNMLLNDTYFTSRGFTRSVLTKMAQGPGLKCRHPPQPPAETKYIRVTGLTDDVEIKEEYLFECPRGDWRESLNHTEAFGFACRPDPQNPDGPQGKYILPNESSWEPCTRDPKYEDGCKVYDRFEAEGKGKDSGLYISRTNPENILIGDYLEYICPENPEIPGQQQVAGWNATFKVQCIGDGRFEKVWKKDWPSCRPPGTCLAVDGPEVPEDTGLVRTYVDKLEFTNISFKCLDKTQEPVGSMVVERPGQGKVIEVFCGRKWAEDGTWEVGTAAWEVPSAWPSCEFKDEFSCDPSTEITIPDWTGLIPENTKFILASSMKEINGVGQMKNEFVSL